MDMPETTLIVWIIFGPMRWRRLPAAQARISHQEAGPRKTPSVISAAAA
jgi:hypothetical protein